ncbi:MAG: Na-translocating system protein MpsC family protein [Thermoleophilaceae bacterium]
MTFLRDILAPHERVLILGGRTDLVCQARTVIREAKREQLIGEVQRVTGRPVLHDSFQF